MSALDLGAAHHHIVDVDDTAHLLEYKEASNEVKHSSIVSLIIMPCEQELCVNYASTVRHLCMPAIIDSLHCFRCCLDQYTFLLAARPAH
jgi:hypothetical protein